MPNRSKLIGLTGPSQFTDCCMEMVEKFLKANFVLIYQNRRESLDEWFDKCDGFILAGGSDIHPSVYGASCYNGRNLTKFDIKRDNRELLLIEHAISKNKPMLGICRGHQIIGVRYGIQVVMDLYNSIICHSPNRSNITISSVDPVHSVKVLDPEKFRKYFGIKEPEGPKERRVFAKIMGESFNDKIWVNSFHHQALHYDEKKMASEEMKDITVFGTAKGDVDYQKKTTREIIEIMAGPNWVSAQFHPEYDWEENTISRAVLNKFKTMLG